MRLKGVVKIKQPIETIVARSSGREYLKQRYVVEDAKTQKMVEIYLFGDDVNRIPVEVGNFVSARCEVESREFNGKWYTSVHALTIKVGIPSPDEKEEEEEETEEQKEMDKEAEKFFSNQPTPVRTTPTPQPQENNDDLPF